MAKKNEGEGKKKSERLVGEGDSLAKKGKFKQALKKYRQAKECDPERADIYDRLISAHDKSTKNWTEEDVAESVGYAMKKQEVENPGIKYLHERLTPEWNEIAEKIAHLISCENEEEEIKLIGEIKSYETAAIYPLIYTLLQIKKGASSRGETEK